MGEQPQDQGPQAVEVDGTKARDESVDEPRAEGQAVETPATLVEVPAREVITMAEGPEAPDERQVQDEGAESTPVGAAPTAGATASPQRDAGSAGPATTTIQDAAGVGAGARTGAEGGGEPAGGSSGRVVEGAPAATRAPADGGKPRDVEDEGGGGDRTRTSDRRDLGDVGDGDDGDVGAGPDGGHVRVGEETSSSIRYAQEITSPDDEPEREGRSLATSHHDVIKQWADERGATPATVDGTEHGDHLGVLRLDFGGDNENLRHVSWDEWFRTFDVRRLNFIYQENRRDGRQSNFFRLESPDREDG